MNTCTLAVAPMPRQFGKLIVLLIGVPLSGSALNGVDALYSTVMMPRGMPVATVAIDNSTNAGLLAIAILAVTDDQLAKKLAAYRERWRDA